jgi:electron transfer flavoprotein beta subunit
MTEPLAVAKIVKGVALAKQPSVINLGQAIDDCNQSGQMLAAPAATRRASKLVIEGKTAPK